MTVTETPPQVTEADVTRAAPVRPTGLAGVVGTADHKVVGRLFIATSLVFVLVSGVAGQLVATERAELDVLANTAILQAFTLHSVAGTFLFLLPLLLGIAMVVVPLQVGSSTIAFPRAAALSYWTFLVSGGLLVGSYAVDGGPGGGSDAGINLWAASFAAVVLSLLLGAICVVTTVAALRAPGMSMSRVPMFSWSMLVAGTVWVLSLPVLIAALLLTYVDHQYGQQSFGLEADLYERVVWAMRQPQVYAYAVPALGIITDTLVTLTGRKLASRTAAMGAIGLAGALGFGAFFQPSINPDAAEQPLFVILAVLAILPLLGLFGLWAELLRSGTRRLASPLVFAVAAGLMLLVATLAGAVLAIPAFDMTGTVAQTGHSHYTLLAATIAGIGALWFWASKIMGRRLPEGLGFVSAVLLLVGTIAVSLPDIISGAFGEDEDAVQGIEWLNTVSAVGGVLALLGVVVAVLGLLAGLRRSGDKAGEVPADPWGSGSTLEWATASPPAYANFAEPPVVTSASPLLDNASARPEEETTR
jgi:heme/copper-type cytochrome/quinol oxidase subunit 1